MKFILLLTALLAVACARDLPYKYHDMEEIVYKYVADVRTLLHDPGVHASIFHMHGDLHIRNDKDGNGTIYWLKDVEVSAFNGENDDLQMHDKWTKLPKESEDILKPFYVEYDEHGLVAGVIFQKDEPEWTHNFKKSIAASVQLHVPKMIKAFEHDHPYTFFANEHTIYGECRVAYETKKSQNDGDIYFVTKYFDPKHCDGHFEQVYTNIVPTQCHEDHDDSYRTPASKVYRVHKEKKFVEQIHSTGKIVMYPFKVQDNLQVVIANQDYMFKEFVKPQKEIDVKQFVKFFPIAFTKPHVGDHVYVPDYTFGRKKIDVDAYVPKMKQMFDEAVSYLQYTYTGSSTAPDTKEGLVINRIIKVLKYFDVEHFEKVWETLQKEKETSDLIAIEMFYKILPSVGTYPSVMFIKKLIEEHKVKDHIAAAMLYTMGVNIHVPSEKLLKELEVFLQWQDKVKPDVYHAAILSYATIIYETYKNHENDENVEKYIKIYYKHMTEAKEYDDQLIWMQGLSNIRIGSVYELLKPIVLGEPVFKYNRHLRAHAIWNIYHPLVDHHVDIFEVFWPVVVDRDLHIELRVAALKAIMRTANMSELYFVFQYMQHVGCPHLYNYFYTAVQAMAHSEIYCDRRANLTAFAEQVEQYFNNAPTSVGTKVWLRDYIDHDYDFGMTVYGNSIANETTNEINQYYIKFDSYLSNNFFNNLGIHIKFEGIQYPIETFLSDLVEFNVDTFKGHLFKRTEEPLHVEITLTHHEQVVFTKYFDENSIKGLFSADFFKLVSMLKYQFVNVQYSFQGEVNVPTDIGFTAQFYTYMPIVTHFKSEVPIYKAEENELTIRTNKFFRIWKHGVYGVNIYNPIAAMTQGVRRVFAFDMNIPINYQLSYNTDRDFLEVKFNKQSSDAYNEFGIKTHVSSQVISVPDKGVDILHETCKECEQYVTVTKGEDYKITTDIVEGDSHFLGLQYYLRLYDCEYSPFDMNHHGSKDSPFSTDFLHEFGHVSFKKFLMHAHQWLVKNAFIYPKGSCGLVFNVKPSYEHSIESLVFKLKLHREYHDDNEIIHNPEFHHVIVPHLRTKLDITVVSKDSEDKMVSEWEGEVEYKHDGGHLFTDLEMHWSRKTNENDEVLNWCFNRNKAYNHEEITGSYIFRYGISHKRECIDDDFFIAVNMHASHSDEQTEERVHEDKHHTYTDCQPHVPWEVEDQVSYNCMYAHSSLRSYTYKINFDNVPKYFEYYFKNLWHYMILAYSPEYVHESEDFVYDKDMLIEIEYPVAYKDPVAQITVSHKDQSYVFHDFPVSKYWWFVQPESLDIPLYFRYAKFLGEYHVCNVFSMVDSRSMPHHFVAQTPSSEWQLYAANEDEKDNATWSIYVKKPEKDDVHLSVKFIIDNHWMVFRPQTVEERKRFGDTVYSASFDPRLMKYFAGKHIDKDFHGLRMFTVDKTIFFSVPEYGMQWSYDGTFVRVVTLDVDHDKYKFYGKCFH